MADKMKILSDVLDRTLDEIEDINRKEKWDKDCVDILGELVDITKDIETEFAMKGYDSENGGYSNRSYPHYYYDGEMMNHGNSYAYRNRDNMGRYSRDWDAKTGMYRGDGYSREDDARHRLEMMMENPNMTESERNAIRSAISRM